MTGIGTVLFSLSDFVLVVTVSVIGDATSVGRLIWLTFSSDFLFIVLAIIIDNPIKINSEEGYVNVYLGL